MEKILGDFDRYYNDVIDLLEFKKFELRDESVDEKPYLITDRPVKEDLKQVLILKRNVEDLSYELIKNKLFYVSMFFDSDAYPILKKIVTMGGKFIPIGGGGKTPYRFVNRQSFEAISRTYSKLDRISKFNFLVHENICESISLTKNVDGDYVEIGVYKGSSALTAINYSELLFQKNIKELNKKFYFIDTFDGFNFEMSKNSQDPMWDKTHKLYGVEKTISYVKDTIGERELNYNLVASDICKDSLPTDIKSISVLSIDVDMYESTKMSIEKGSPYVSVGGIILLEDAPATPSLYGAFLAMEEFLESEEGQKYLKIYKTGHYFLIKQRK